MQCLQNRIGIRGCGAPSSDAVAADPDADPPVLAQPALPILLINQLPGISLQKIDAMADGEQETFLGVWNDIVLRTMKKFEVLVKAKINQCFKIVDKVTIQCLVCSNKELFDLPLWYLHGAELMIEITSSDVINRYTTIDIEKAELLKADFYTEFERSLSDAVQSLDIMNSDCIADDDCIECNDSVKFTYGLP